MRARIFMTVTLDSFYEVISAVALTRWAGHCEGRQCSDKTSRDVIKNAEIECLAARQGFQLEITP